MLKVYICFDITSCPTFKKNTMNKLFAELSFFLLISTIFCSCSKEDTYTDLSEESKELLTYEAGDTFELRNLVNDEIIELTVSFKNFDYYRDTNPGWWLGSYGGDDFYEYGEYYFTNETNCYTGSVMIKARSNGNFEFSIGTGDCFGEYLTTFEFNSLAFEYNSDITSININNVEYPETYILNSRNNTIFYTKENGIIQIVDNDIETEIFEIVE